MAFQRRQNSKSEENLSVLTSPVFVSVFIMALEDDGNAKEESKECVFVFNIFIVPKSHLSWVVSHGESGFFFHGQSRVCAR